MNAERDETRRPGPWRGPGPGPEGMWRRYLAWIAFALVLSLIWTAGQREARVAAISYTEFKEGVRAGEVSEVTFRGERIRGRYVAAPGTQATPEAPSPSPAPDAAPRASRFETVRPAVDDPELMALLESHGVEVRAQPSDPPWWAALLTGILPWILILGLFLYISYRLQQRMAGGSGGPFGFMRSRAKRVERTASDVTFDDVAGLENVRRDLAELVEYLRDPSRFRALGAKPPKGILLTGPPGTGKTLVAKAVAGEADVAFFHTSGSEFIEMFVGVGAARVRSMFADAKQHAPAIIFIDELDAIGRSRGSGLGGGHDEREQTLNQILSEMDGFEPSESVVVMAATNRPDVLDPALLRPGRFDRKLTLDLPRREARRQILAVHTRDVPLAGDVDLERIAGLTIGFAGADLENLVNEAAMLAGREERSQVTMEDFAQARDTITLGARREGMLSEEEKRRVAHHEAGHAVAAYFSPRADPLEKVSIVPRGQALGATQQLPEEDRYLQAEGYLRDRIAVMLAGRVAEQIVFGEVTSGAEEDLKQATRLARRMITHWGMSDAVGPVAFRSGEEHVFLGREIAQSRDFGEAMAELIDQEIRALMIAIGERTTRLLESHRAELEALAAALLERETLGADEVKALFAAQHDGPGRRRVGRAAGGGRG